MIELLNANAELALLVAKGAVITTAIQTSVNAGNKATACAGITNFLGLVNAQTGKKLSPANVTLLKGDAQALAATLGGC